MGRDVLGDDGTVVGLPAPPRAAGEVRYGDRFRPTATSLQLGSSGHEDTVALDFGPPTSTGPSWLTRGAAVLAVAVAAVVATATDIRTEAAPTAEPEARQASAERSFDPQARARLYASRVEGGVWDHGRFSYEVTLSPAGTAVRLDVAAASTGEGGAECSYLGGPPRFGWVYWC